MEHWVIESYMVSIVIVGIWIHFIDTAIKEVCSAYKQKRRLNKELWFAFLLVNIIT